MVETIHIPAEVVEAAAREIVSLNVLRAPQGKYEHADIVDNFMLARAKSTVRAAITAALSAWVETGMAREAHGYPVECRPSDWKIDTAYCGDAENSFPVIILRTTEAP